MSAERKTLIDKMYHFSINQYVYWRHHFKEYFWAILIAIIIRSTVVTLYKIPTPSMVPSIKVGDMLIANHFYYGLKIPFTQGLDGFRIKAIKKVEVGDIIIFQAPQEENFYIIDLNAFSRQGHELLLKLNEKSSFKRPLSLEKNNRINYLYLSEPFQWQEVSRIFLHESLYDDFISELSTNKLAEPYLSLTVNVATGGFQFLQEMEKKLNAQNIEMSYFPREGEFTSVFLPKSAYTLYHQAFEDANTSRRLKIIAKKEETQSIVVYGTDKQQHYMTYYENRYRGLGRSILYPTLSMVGLVSTVLINSPPFIVYRLGINAVEKIFLGKNIDVRQNIVWYPNRFNNTNKDFVKRVIAKGGDTVKIINKKIYVNDKAYEWRQSIEQGSTMADVYLERIPIFTKKGKEKIKEHLIRIYSYNIETPEQKFPTKYWPLDPNIRSYGLGEDYKDNFGPIVVPDNHYFALGDNRDESLDSRYWGFVPEWAIKGKPMLIVWPFNRFQKVK